jgi:hypothetical protein
MRDAWMAEGKECYQLQGLQYNFQYMSWNFIMSNGWTSNIKSGKEQITYMIDLKHKIRII